MKLLYACGIAWILFVGLQIGKFGYDSRYSWQSRPASTGMLLSDGGSIAFSSSRSLPQPIKKSLDKDDPPRLSPPRNHPPLSFVAGANIWHIYYTTKEFTAAADCDAWTDTEKHTVWIAITAKDSRELLTHELMHVARQVARESAPYDDYHFDPTDENYFVQPSAPYFQHILHDNKALAEWILG